MSPSNAGGDEIREQQGHACRSQMLLVSERKCCVCNREMFGQIGMFRFEGFVTEFYQALKIDRTGVPQRGATPSGQAHYIDVHSAFVASQIFTHKRWQQRRLSMRRDECTASVTIGDERGTQGR
ncbi:hypothetical protein CAPTEDRAFT_214653 [Capitella teleta]|uniref:Uncharacterized protein n=1 Tax=Capitella teleta TaxID=283909 RepID=R7UG28_CAPTE|nr:hypothetical protein CAPTEDRAFT_214653 [Capitella teleta]|eukprot:ELU05150.1 hypothetical protein CAPTEDRAFT_214653 [Capitella teleta]